MIFALIILIIFPKASIQIAVNEINNPIFDSFFKYITHIGSGIPLIILIITLLFFNKRIALISGLSALLMSIIVVVMKTMIFAERPISFFQYSFKTDYIFHYVDGVNIHSYSSFPSGHTATAFTLFLLLSIIFYNRHKISQIIFFILALLVGYSRMYLSQHFLADVLAGAVIGVFSVYLTSFLIIKFLPNLSSNSILKSRTND